MTEIIPHSSSSSDVKKSFHGFLANLSELTAKEYARATGEFLNFVAKDDVRHPSELKKHHLVLFRRELERNGLAKKTILKKMSAVSSMCKHLAEEGHVEKDITYGVKRPRSENKKETADLTDEEVKKVFASLNPKRFNYFAYRAMLAVGFYTG